MTRGIRNNNPLNIRRSADRWEGAAMTQTDKEFVQFESMAYGYRAAWKTLESYWHHFHATRQPYTPATIISRWAPPSENDTQNYIRTVLRLSGLGGNENLPQPSRGVDIPRLERLLTAMTTMECGIPYSAVDTASIRQGFDLAFPGKRSLARTQPASPDIDPTTLEDLLAWDEYGEWG